MTRAKTWVAAAGLAALCGLTLSAVPGKWKVPDGGKQISQRPSGMNWAIVTNFGPESVTLTSKGATSTSTAVIPPDNVTYSFSVPAQSKNVVIRDEVSGTGAGAKGVLFWAKQGAGNTTGSSDPNAGTTN